jgi:hypothetical protein
VYRILNRITWLLQLQFRNKQSESSQASPASEGALEASTLAIPTPKKEAIKKAIKKEVTRKEDEITKKRLISAESAERNIADK